MISLYRASLSYIGVLLYTFYCNSGRAEVYRSLYTADFVKSGFIKSRFQCSCLILKHLIFDNADKHSKERSDVRN